MTTLSDDDCDEADNVWQQIPTKTASKRRLTKSPNVHQYKKLNLSTEASSSKQNKFQLLDNEDMNEDFNESEASFPKPPPIFIPNVTNIKKMLNEISTIIANSDFNYKSMKDSQIRLMVKNVDAYRKIVKFFEVNKINFHTYQLKQERAYRIVIKGIHHSTPIEDIKAELLYLGHQVRAIVNVKSKLTKLPLSMFFVDLDPNENNKDIFNVKSLNNAIVTIEPPKKTEDIVQCYRCQQFGHTKTYCKKPFRCVKCGMDHQTADCTKNLNIPPKCVNCLKEHTANYKGCQIYQELLSKRRGTKPRYFSDLRQTSEDVPDLNTRSNFTHTADNNANTTNGITYAQVVAGNSATVENRFMERLERMMDKMFEMMTQIMLKLCR